MTVVEHDLLNKSEDNELKHHPVKRRQFSAEAAAAPLHHDERHVHERNANDCLIDGHHHHGMSQLSTVNLQRHRSTRLTADMILTTSMFQQCKITQEV